jgi:hypothetical protein
MVTRPSRGPWQMRARLEIASCVRIMLRPRRCRNWPIWLPSPVPSNRVRAHTVTVISMRHKENAYFFQDVLRARHCAGDANIWIHRDPMRSARARSPCHYHPGKRSSRSVPAPAYGATGSPAETQVPAAADLALVGRFASHAIEIGRRVVFQTTGTLPPIESSTY